MNTANAERWKVYDGPQINPMFSGIVCMISANDRLICVISEDEMPVSPERWPDIARLIAAAPDMLATLKAFNLKEEWIVSGTAETLTLRVPIAVIQQAAAAVAKASQP